MKKLPQTTESCWTCPFHMFDNVYKNHFCNLKWQKLEMDFIPDWCPLENIDE